MDIITGFNRLYCTVKLGKYPLPYDIRTALGSNNQYPLPYDIRTALGSNNQLLHSSVVH